MSEEDGTQEVDGQPGVYEIKDAKAVLDALARAKKDAKAYREAADAATGQNKSLLDRIAALEGDEGIALWKKRAINESAKQLLASAGIKGADRVLGFMDLSKVDMSDDGKMTGFDESLENVKKNLPELFDNKRRVGGQADANSHEGVSAKKSSTEQQVDRLFSNR